MITIDTAFIKSLNPCEERYVYYLQHYKDFSGSVKEFLELKEITVKDKEWVILYGAFKKIEILKEALKYSSLYDPADNDNYAIQRASLNGHEKVVELLLAAKDKNGNYRLNPADGDNYAIQLSSANGHVKVVELLLAAKDSSGKYRVDPASNDNIAIKRATENGHLEIVKLLEEAIKERSK